MEMISARKEVSMVPNKKGAAPYTLFRGSQVVPQRYFRPKCFMEGMDSRISVNRMPATSITMATPTTTRDCLNNVSVLIFPLEPIAFFIIISYKLLVVGC